MEKEKYLPGYTQRREQLYKTANILLILTILFNMIRGSISLTYGFMNNSLALLGFGIDSFVELVYGAVVWNVVQRTSEESFTDISGAEQKILKITGIAFYALSCILLIASAYNIFRGYEPGKTSAGAIIAVISFSSAFALFYFKSNIGDKLDSNLITADAGITKTSLYTSACLLISSLGYIVTLFGIFDSLGAVLISVFIFFKGRKALQKIRVKSPGNI